MRLRRFVTLALQLVFAGCGFLAGQVPARASSPAVIDPPGALRTGTTLVLVDVVVLDRTHRPMTHLQASDFTVKDDGAIQTLTSFEHHDSASAGISGLAQVKEEPGVFTNAAPDAATASLTVLLIDTLNTQVPDQSFVRSQLQNFLKSSGSERIAVFALRNDRLMMLQGFTTDVRLLKAAVGSADAGAASGLLTDAMGGGADNPTNRQTDQGKTLQLRLRDRYTLEAINQLGQYLTQFPGRKNLLWFSGSFPVGLVPESSAIDDLDLDAEARRRATVALLTESRVAVYPIDSHGQPQPFGTDTSNSESRYVKRPDLMADELNLAGQDEGMEHLTMEQVARETGGQAFYNTNGVSQAITKAIGDGSSYYTLGYKPDGGDTLTGNDKAFHAIEVKVAGGYELAYRRGYFPDGGQGAMGPGAQRHSDAGEPTFSEAMRKGAPDRLQIVYRARVLPTVTGVQATADATNVPDRKIKGPWRRYAIDIAADPRPMSWTNAGDGVLHGRLELEAVVYDQDGRPVNSLTNTIVFDFSRSQFIEAGRTGVGVPGQISIPAKGTYWLRIGVHDPVSDKTGTLELPVAALKDLPSLSSAAP